MNTIPIKDEKKYVNLIREDFANQFNIAFDGQNFFFNILTTVYIKDFNNMAPRYFKFYTVQEGDTWTNLSYQFYRTIELYWIICKINNVINPMEMPQEGQMLKILTSEVVFSIIDQIKNNKK